MKKWYKICGMVGFFLTISLQLMAQNALLKPVLLQPGPFFLTKKNNQVLAMNRPENLVHRKKPTPNINLGVTPNGATRNFGFFCRAELKSDAVLKFPVRFRLGSVQYCDYMEGKGNSR